jgi:hypothetical protein
MAYPDLTPSSRQFDPGNWPVKTYNAQDGTEVRLLYGNRRTKMKLELRYSNVSDANAELFFDHFESVKGTFETFELPSGSKAVAGWAGTESVLTGAGSGNRWRYEEAPVIENVRPGVSNVSVSLVGVF